MVHGLLPHTQKHCKWSLLTVADSKDEGYEALCLHSDVNLIVLSLVTHVRIIKQSPASILQSPLHIPPFCSRTLLHHHLSPFQEHVFFNFHPNGPVKVIFTLESYTEFSVPM